MCGIIGIVGREPVAGLLVESLKRLEYRGYDSAGVATLEAGSVLTRRRAEGKLRNLEIRLAKEPLTGLIGIGHTRWATHGAPTEANAHPHATARVAVVHNGIIENFRELRDELEAAGQRFASETDTEVVAQLVDYHLARGESPAASVAATLKRLTGAFALAFLFPGHDDLVIGARRGSPLAVGWGEGEMYLGSDAIALAPFTDRIAYLEEGDWVEITRAGATIHDETDAVVERPIVVVSAAAFQVDRGSYRHFMAKEIHEQPEVVGHTLAHYLDLSESRIRLPTVLPFDWADLSRLSIVACGTAYYAGLVAKYWFEQWARLPVEIDVASEFRYREPPLPKNGLALFVSQSGETADTLASLRYCKAEGQHTAAVVNVPTSTIARESEAIFPTLAGPEIGVASTKAFTCQLSVMASLAGVISSLRTSAANPNSGTGYELEVIAMVVIGGTALTGGRGTIIGTVLGICAGYFGGRVDAVLSYVITTRLALPVVLVALASAALVGGSLEGVIIVLGLLLWDRFAVVTRSATQQIVRTDYVAAAQAIGCSTPRILFMEILPNILNALIVVATLEVAHAILLEAALSFLGLGVQPPLPSWGLMISEGKQYMFFSPWVIGVPATALIFLVLAINLVGDGLRDVTAPENRT